MLAKMMGGGIAGVNITISSDQTTYNLFTAAGSPSTDKDVTVTVNAAVYVGSFDTGTGWTSGSTIKLINNGYVVGVGGAAQSAGGNAILLRKNLTIDNTNGVIGGGGGGGNTGLNGPSLPWGVGGFREGGGGGGGGGRGYPGGTHGGASSATDPGADGTDGTKTAKGNGGAPGTYLGSVGGKGGDGGDLGDAGSQADANSDHLVPGSSPGAAGKAVNLNGFAVMWIGGNNPSQVKGAVS